MKSLSLTIALVLIMCLAMDSRAGDHKDQPATQPVRPPSRMMAELTGPVSLQGGVPITLTLFSESDGERRFTNYSFMFVLLDEDGHQVGGPHVFIREAIRINLELNGKESTYKPRLAFYPDREGLVVGCKYQLVCLLPQYDLISAVWFTLTK
jgi:hypothetical protein